ncbi:hypothetical protein ACE4Z5_26090, partial [Salmonella enterica]|uniref:hypothetical protein n=1 Tax=Salmonella enterica TaxID=28901 RepID=UPI003D28CDED
MPPLPLAYYGVLIPYHANLAQLLAKHPELLDYMIQTKLCTSLGQADTERVAFGWYTFGRY